MHKALFIDKDGTLIKDVPYNVNPDRIELYPDVKESMQILKENNFKVVVISNQAGVAHGYFEEKALDAVWQKLHQLLEPINFTFDGFYYCPHHINGTLKKYAIQCDCRKPLPGLIRKAADDLDIDLEKSWMVGDILNDIEAGNRAGVKSILVHRGNETEWALSEIRTPMYIVKKVREAVTRILKYEKLHAYS